MVALHISGAGYECRLSQQLPDDVGVIYGDALLSVLLRCPCAIANGAMPIVVAQPDEFFFCQHHCTIGK